MTIYRSINALVESFNGLCKWELIYPKGPWTGLADVEGATLTYVDWSNNRRLHGGITPGAGYTTPADHEAGYYRQNVPTEPAGTQTPEFLWNPGRFSWPTTARLAGPLFHAYDPQTPLISEDPNIRLFRIVRTPFRCFTGLADLFASGDAT